MMAYTVDDEQAPIGANDILWGRWAYDEQSIDIDAGRVDETLERQIRQYKTEVAAQKAEMGMEGLPTGLFLNSLMYSRDFEYGEASIALADALDEPEKEKVMETLASTMTQAAFIKELFPAGENGHGGMHTAAEDAYGESVTKLVYTLLALKRGDKLPTRLPLKGGGKVRIGTYSFDEALTTIQELDTAVGAIHRTMEMAEYPFMGTYVNRVNETGAYGMYRIIDRGGAQVLATIRLRAGTSADPAIEYSNREGTQASIGYTIDAAKEFPSPFKEEQVSPFSVRIDNEGDKIALDIGSILGKPGTLGKRVADLIAIGDMLHSRYTGEELSLNHNGRSFEGQGLEKPEVFARDAARRAEWLERLASGCDVRQFVLKHTVAS